MQDAQDNGDLDRRLGQKLKAARQARGWTLEDLAGRTGVSRAMVSRVERGESSPTATLLMKLTTGLGISLSSLFGDRAAGGPVARRAEQPVWQDPASCYVRRNVSPAGSGSDINIVDVEVPAGARIVIDRSRPPGRTDQQVWVLDGVLELTLGAVTHRLETGDCLHMRLDQPIAFHNPGTAPVRYAVVLMISDGA
ncbi:DNA-binding protein [Bosea sp. Leaf344]|uniref:helix-turn-helix domain-containing protein n=1 Tax=Bosea sp. Leaf344 TaxID=1736346 RepID=UPI0006F59559|nr:XRE family transcriptional regulator [Bosea sp. Leaf344]KQU54645.1 DNA-binding protein [Bosea sp. Leaf344]